MTTVGDLLDWQRRLAQSQQAHLTRLERLVTKDLSTMARLHDRALEHQLRAIVTFLDPISDLNAIATKLHCTYHQITTLSDANFTPQAARISQELSELERLLAGFDDIPE